MMDEKKLFLDLKKRFDADVKLKEGDGEGARRIFEGATMR